MPTNRERGKLPHTRSSQLWYGLILIIVSAFFSLQRGIRTISSRDASLKNFRIISLLVRELTISCSRHQGSRSLTLQTFQSVIVRFHIKAFHFAPFKGSILKGCTVILQKTASSTPCIYHKKFVNKTRLLTMALAGSEHSQYQ